MRTLNYSKKEIDILELLEIVWKKKFWIFALAVVAAVISFILVSSSAPQYEASGVMYVTNKDYSVQSTDDTVYKSDIDSSRSMVTTYLEILKSRSFLTEVSDALDGKYSWQEIYRMVSLSAVNDTELIMVRVVSDDPQDSHDVVRAVLDKAPEEMFGIFQGGSVQIVDDASYPNAPIGNGLIKKTVLGFMVGAVLGVLIVFLIKFFDQKIHKASELTERYNISVLGEIRR